MANIKTSSMFGAMQGLSTSKDLLDDVSVNNEDYYDLDEVLEDICMSGDYKMLPLVVTFMKDMIPYDLFSFFDTFSKIEYSIFEKHQLDYKEIRVSYEKHRMLIKDNYIKFIVEYYKESYRRIYDDDVNKYTEEQEQFLSERFNSVRYLLIAIGKRLSSVYYSDIIVDD